MTVAILGAGPAGLGAALPLASNATVFEASESAGGLCQSVNVGAAVFDLGGHSFHTPHPAIRELVFRVVPMEEQPRNAWCYVQGEWVPYPFQKNFDRLTNVSVRAECEAGLSSREMREEPLNFDDYLQQRFGVGVYRHFRKPYNEKLWGHDLTRLAADWTNQRVAAPRGTEEQFLQKGGQRRPLQSDTQVAYPARGGFGDIFQALAQQIACLKLRTRVTHINPLKRTLTIESGEQFEWEHMISTLPLPSLLNLFSAVPTEVRQAVSELRSLPVTLVMLAGSPVGTEVQRIYCSDPEILAHKIVLNHNSSNYLRSMPVHGVQAEISGQQNMPDQQLVQKVIQEFKTLGLGEFAESVTASQVIRLPNGYPVPTHGRTKQIEIVRSWLSMYGIELVGRFAEWAYINSDEALHRGWQLGERVIEQISAGRRSSREKREYQVEAVA